jgi:HK97 family phage major capsid protein
MAKLHDLKKELAAFRATLKADRFTLNQKMEELPTSEPIPTDVQDLHRRVTDTEKAANDHEERIGVMEQAQKDDGDAAGEGGGEGDGDKGFLFGMSHNKGPSWTPFGYGEPQKRPDGKGFKAARFAFGRVVAKIHGMEAAQQYVERVLQDVEVAKALNTTGVATGGALIPQAFSNEIIELLRAETVIRACEPTIVDMPLGNLTIPRLAAGATAGYQGELDDMSSSQETFDDLQLNAKKLTALVPVSNDLLRRASQNLERIIRDDMVQTLARREDLAFLLGDGSGTSPIGLLNLCLATSKLIVAPFTATDNATILTAVVGVLMSMILTLKNNFSRMIRVRWIMTPTTEMFLMGLRDQVGNFVFKDEMDERHTLYGFQYKTTQQLPTNITAALLGGGTANDGAYIFLADFADVILAETYNMVVDASDVASYKDAGGNMVSAFIRDQTAFRIITEHDFNMRHLASVAAALLPAWAPAGWTGFSGGSPYFVQALSGDMSAAPSVQGVAPPTGSNNPGNASANVPGGTLPGRA